MNAWDSRIVRHWCAELDVEPSAFSGDSLTCGLQKDRQDLVLVYTHCGAHIVLVPRNFEPCLRRPPADFSASALTDWLGVSLEPRWADIYAYATAPFPALPLPAPVRWLVAEDAPALDKLKAACTPEELALAQITMDDPLITGCFTGDALVGVASILDINADVADIGVLTHPDWRGQSIAPGLAILLRNAVVELGRVAQYTTTLANQGSMRTAEKAGFDLFLVETGYTVRDESD